MHRLPLLALGFVSLVGGVLGGLSRLGWLDLPVSADAALAHGPLMVCGFFGTLIGLERAVALGRGWAYVAPAAGGAGGLAALTGAPSSLTEALFTISSVVLLAASLHVALRHRAVFTAVVAGGAGCWFAGNMQWLAGADPQRRRLVDAVSAAHRRR